ncbi:MAG: FG-GAP-like repeat-containing protein, partial [Acidobacteriota bacterium]|nr:FG-GAP-like repeat-containing protein [Acidobacteriota bacterium]
LSLSIVCASLLHAADCTRTLEQATRYTTPEHAIAIVTANFGGDSRPDVAVASGKQVLPFVTRDGVLFRQPAITLPDFVWKLFTNDVDADGRTDVIAIGRNFLATLFSNGNGTFRAVLTATERKGLGANIAAYGDVTGDGRLDVILPTANALYVFAGKSDGTFAETPNPQPLSRSARGVVAGDFTGDGKIDVALVDSYDLLLFEGTAGSLGPARSLLPPASSESFLSIVTNDFDSDGRPDILVTGARAPSLFLSTRGLTSPVSHSVGGGTYLSTGDFDGDGKLDVASSGTTLIYRGNGDGTFVSDPRPASAGVGGFYAIVPADLDGDGRVDIIAATNAGVGVHYGRAAETNGATTSFATPRNTADLLVGDVNRDGRADVIVPDIVTRVYYGQANGTLIEAQRLGFQSGVSTGVLGDFNGDGLVDLMPGPHVGIAFGQPEGGFKAPLYESTSFASPFHMKTIDVNRDGKLDVVQTVTGGANRGVTFLINDGTAHFTEQVVPLPAGLVPRSLAVAEVTGDAIPDVIVIAGDSLLLLPSGNGTPVTIATGVADNVGRATALVVVDFDGDGLLDIAAPAADNGGVLIFPGSGNGTFREPRRLRVDDSTDLALTAADFSGDGRIDLVVASFDRDAVLYEQQPDRSFVETTRFANIRAYGVEAADIDGDAHPDLVLNDFTGPVHVQLNRCVEELHAIPPVVTIDATSARNEVTLVARVPADAAGSVTFYRGVKTEFFFDVEAIGTAPIVNGVATLTAQLPAGRHELHAVYSGEGHYASAQSPRISRTISTAPHHRRSVRH